MKATATAANARTHRKVIIFFSLAFVSSSSHKMKWFYCTHTFPRSPFCVDDVNVTVEAIQRQTGLAVLQRGPCYAYIDSLHQLGAVVEVAKQC